MSISVAILEIQKQNETTVVAVSLTQLNVYKCTLLIFVLKNYMLKNTWFGASILLY